MAVPVVIELDLSTPWMPPEPTIRRSWPRLRWVLTAVVLAAVALVPIGDARARSLDARFTVGDVNSFELTERFAVTMQAHPATTTIQAYRLADGRRLWSMELSGGIVYVDDERVLLSRDVQSTGDAEVIALDTATGRQVWRQPAMFIGPAADARIALFDGWHVETVAPQAPTDGTGNGDENVDIDREGQPTWPSRRRVAVDMRTGQERWSVTIPIGTADAWAYRIEGVSRYSLQAMYELDPAGELRRRDLATGAVAERVDLRRTGPISAFSVVGTRAFVSEREDSGLDVHDTVTGQRVWRVPPRPNVFTSFLECGPLLCEISRGGLWAVDPGTGRFMWNLVRFNNPLAVHDGQFVMTQFDLPGAAVEPEALVIDAGTGRALRRVTGWRLAQPLDWPRFLASRNDRRGMVEVSILDIDTGHATVLGRAENWFADGTCGTNNAYVACLSPGGGLLVWDRPDRADDLPRR